MILEVIGKYVVMGFDTDGAHLSSITTLKAKKQQHWFR